MANKRHKTEHDTRQYMKAFKAARIGRGWDLQKAADVLDISVEHLRGIESRGRKPGVDLLISIFELYNEVSLDAVFHPEKQGEGDIYPDRLKFKEEIDSMPNMEFDLIKTISTTFRAYSSEGEKAESGGTLGGQNQDGKTRK